METKFKTYTEEQVKNLFKDYEIHNIMVDSEQDVVFFKFEDSFVYGECELIYDSDAKCYYWNVSCGSKHCLRGGNNHYSTLEDCLKFANHMY
jgi:hypothetical protein